MTVVGTGELGAFHGFSHKSLRSRSLYKLLACFAEEKLLHEEVHTSWEEAQRLGAAGDLADELRPHLPPGVSLLPEHRARTATSTQSHATRSVQVEVTFIGTRPRTKEVLQRRMYHSEIQKWLAEDDDSEGITTLHPWTDRSRGKTPVRRVPGSPYWLPTFFSLALRPYVHTLPILEPDRTTQIRTRLTPSLSVAKIRCPVTPSRSDSRS